MARARAAVVLALAVCCLLVATAPARRPVDLQPARAADAVAVVDRGAAPKDCAEAGTTALAVPEEEEDVARVDAASGGAPPLEVRPSSVETTASGGAPASEVRPSSVETTTTVEKGWGWSAVSGKAEDDERRRPYDSDSDSDSDSDCDSDSDDEDEGGIFGWLWRLVDHLF